MRSQLTEIKGKQRDDLIKKLYEKQAGKCFICGESIDLKNHQVDIDHITSITKGLDSEQNWALVHARCNRSKGNRPLQLMQYIYRYRKDREKFLEKENDFNVGHALDACLPKRNEVFARELDSTIEISYLGEARKSRKLEFGIILDRRNNIRSFVGYIPFQCLFHDPNINPRSILDLEPMIEEFYSDNPQLQPSLAILLFNESEGKGKISLFDGQHKAAAQLYLGNDELLTRVFINPDKDKIKETNFRAHTIVAQIHFPEFIKDKVGHDIFKQGFDHYCDTAEKSNDSEEKFIQKPEVGNDYRQHLQSYLKYEALFGSGRKHEILNYVEAINVRSKKHPLSYDTLDKTFLKFFLFLRSAKEPLVTSEKYRALEKENLGTLMSIFVDEVLERKFDLSKGIFKIEDSILENRNSIDTGHLAAYRICRRPAMIVWVDQLQKAIVRMFKTKDKYDKADWADERVLWVEMDSQDSKMIRRMFQVIQQHKIWIEKDNAETVQALASTRQRDWREILLDGKLPGRPEKSLSPLTDTKIYDLAYDLAFPHQK